MEIAELLQNVIMPMKADIGFLKGQMSIIFILITANVAVSGLHWRWQKKNGNGNGNSKKGGK